MNRTARTQDLYDGLIRGWNTFDVRSVSSMVHMPDRLEINFAFAIPGTSEFVEDMAWAEVESFGEHADDGGYTDITLRYMGGLYRLETASHGSSLVARVTPLTVRRDLYVLVQVRGVWGFTGSIKSCSGSKVECLTDEGGYAVEALTPPAALPWNPSKCHSLAFTGDAPVYIRVNTDADQAGIDAMLEGNKAAWLERTITGDGATGEALDALRRSLMWNTVYDAHHNRVISPVSRNWCRGGFGDYVLFDWDTFFAALLFGLFNKELAYANIFGMLEDATDDGMIPNFGSGKGPSGDRSEPQVGSWCVWKLYLQHGDKWIIEESFDALLAWNRWRFRERDFNGDGLLELGSTPFIAGDDGNVWAQRHMIDNKQAAMYESGLDNSPMFDDAVYNGELHALELSYVGLNGLMAADCQVLAKMADLLGRNDEKRELDERYAKLSRLINSELWDEETGSYLNRHWSGEFSSSLGPPCFYPLMAGIVGTDRAERILKEHILNPEEFWGEYVFPMISRNDPAFMDQEYWRGRIWGPTNFLLMEGMRRYGWESEVEAAAESGFRLFHKRWAEAGVVGENYNAITGEAAEHGKSSDRFYHWGALLVYTAIQEAFDAQVWDDAVKLESSPGWLGPIRNILYKGERINL